MSQFFTLGDQSIRASASASVLSMIIQDNQSWIFIGTTDAEAETPIFWPPDSKKGLTGKDPDVGKD